MVKLYQFLAEPHRCAYLPDRDACTEYTFLGRVSPAEYEELMDRGYRKFGRMLFRPRCGECGECRPIRIPVERFQPDRSQRRARKANQDLEVRCEKPVVDRQRLQLYRRYHAARAEQKGWPESRVDAQEYHLSYVQNPVPSIEISVWEGEALLGVALTDVTPNVVSGIYHYHDPGLAHRSLGTFCMLQVIELARRLEKRWAYFGYYVRGCGSLEYKARFRPCELLGEDGVWRPFGGPAADGTESAGPHG